MFKLVPFESVRGKGRRLTSLPQSPWLVGDGDEAAFVASLAASGATWQRITHKVGWFKKLHLLQATPAEMVVVESFLRDAHRQLGTEKLVVGVPSSDVIIAADHAEAARVLAITTLRYTEKGVDKLSPDLLVVESGVIVGMVLNTLLEREQPKEANVTRVLRVGPNAEFHVTAGNDTESLFGLADRFVSFAVEKWLPDPQFRGDCTLFVTASETMTPALDELASVLAAEVDASGCTDRLRFRVERIPC